MLFGENTLEVERCETVQELSDLLFVVQEMGRRLANETHGDAYEMVRDLNTLFHQTRLKIDQIQQATRQRSH